MENDGCLSDIDNAIKHGYRETNRFKLEERRAKFLLSINKNEEAKEAFDTAIKYASKAKLSKEETQKLANNFEKISTKSVSKNNSFLKSDFYTTQLCGDTEKMNLECNPIFPSLSKDFDVEFNGNQGRFIAAKRKFKVNEIIAIEKPYEQMLNSMYFLEPLFSLLQVLF